MSVSSVSLQQPSISLTSADGGLHWSPEAAEITKGHSFVITCSISPQFPEGVFSLFFCGFNTTDTKPVVNHSASFEFPIAEYEHQGNYSCVYEVILSSRTFSAVTTSIRVIITSAGSLVLLLLVLVVICLVRKRRQQAVASGVLQLSVRNLNEDLEDDEEQHYENFVQAKYKKRQKVQASGLVDGKMSVRNLNEDLEDDEEQHYENFEQARYKKRQKVRARGLVDKDHDDYERKERVQRGCVQSQVTSAAYHCKNLNQLFTEDSLDIYGEKEDVYQNISFSTAVQKHRE
nr:PREDICTED: uncharacterized protein LOC109640444 [Paralichthys olivaceus]